MKKVNEYELNLLKQYQNEAMKIQFDTAEVRLEFYHTMCNQLAINTRVRDQYFKTITNEIRYALFVKKMNRNVVL